MSNTDWFKRLEDNDITVGIIGLGYVGLPLCDMFCKSGLKVVGYDTDNSKIEAINEGRTYLDHLPDDLVRNLNRSGLFKASISHDVLKSADVILICVPTPLGKHLEPDLSYVEDAISIIQTLLIWGSIDDRLIILESTTYPGTSKRMSDTLESGLRHVGRPKNKCGDGYYFAYSPEREDPGCHSGQSIPKLVGGIDKESANRAYALYCKVFDQVHKVKSTEIAEAAKLLENIYRAVNIALVNELKIVLQAMNVNIWDVIKAASTKPFGFQAFYPGPGLGGHCIPIDPYYLSWKAKEHGVISRFIELAGEVNRMMPNYVVSKVIEALNSNEKPVSGSCILILGLAYKPDVDDLRESPALKLWDELEKMGADIWYSDPHIPEYNGHTSVDLSRAVNGFDCVIVATNHTKFEEYGWKRILDEHNLVVDTRGVSQNTGVYHPNVFMA